MVSADPIRMFLYRWMIETGDPVEVVAKGFDLEPDLVGAILSGKRFCIGKADDERIRSQLGLGK